MRRPAEAGLVKTGAGTLTVGLANTHTGGTEVESGTLLVRNPAGLGTGPHQAEQRCSKRPLA